MPGDFGRWQGVPAPGAPAFVLVWCMWGVLMVRPIFALPLLLAAAVPAWAQSFDESKNGLSQVQVSNQPAPASDIPAPGDFALFGLGVLGLVLGRYGSRKRPPDA